MQLLNAERALASSRVYRGATVGRRYAQGAVTLGATHGMPAGFEYSRDAAAGVGGGRLAWSGHHQALSQSQQPQLLARPLGRIPPQLARAAATTAASCGGGSSSAAAVAVAAPAPRRPRAPAAPRKSLGGVPFILDIAIDAEGQPTIQRIETVVGPHARGLRVPSLGLGGQSVAAAKAAMAAEQQRRQRWAARYHRGEAVYSNNPPSYGNVAPILPYEQMQLQIEMQTQMQLQMQLHVQMQAAAAASAAAAAAAAQHAQQVQAQQFEYSNAPAAAVNSAAATAAAPQQ